jgi:hypothetical protein
VVLVVLVSLVAQAVLLPALLQQAQHQGQLSGQTP